MSLIYFYNHVTFDEHNTRNILLFKKRLLILLSNSCIYFICFLFLIIIYLLQLYYNKQCSYFFPDFTDASAFWMFPYESQNMRQEIDEVWEQVNKNDLF